MTDSALDALVEAMARGMYEQLVPPDPWWEGEDEEVQGVWTARASAFLTAALAFRSSVDCAQPLCRNGVLFHPDATTVPLPMGPCPDCVAGKVPGDPVLIRRDELEQVPGVWVAMTAHYVEDNTFGPVAVEVGEPYRSNEPAQPGDEPVYLLKGGRSR